MDPIIPPFWIVYIVSVMILLISKFKVSITVDGIKTKYMWPIFVPIANFIFAIGVVTLYVWSWFMTTRR